MIDILEHVRMSDCKLCSTPVDTCAKLSSDGTPVSDATQYHGLVGALQYLTFTRPNIAYAVQQVCLYMHDPREPHLTLVKRILWYIQGTLDYGLQLHRSSTADLVTYSNVEWLAAPTLVVLHQVTVSSSATTWYFGLQSGSTLSPALVPKPNTAVLPMPSPKLLGHASYLKNFTHLLVELLLFTTTTSVSFIS
jgi:hypothetical protein